MMYHEYEHNYAKKITSISESRGRGRGRPPKLKHGHSISELADNQAKQEAPIVMMMGYEMQSFSTMPTFDPFHLLQKNEDFNSDIEENNYTHCHSHGEAGDSGQTTSGIEEQQVKIVALLKTPQRKEKDFQYEYEIDDEYESPSPERNTDPPNSGSSWVPTDEELSEPEPEPESPTFSDDNAEELEDTPKPKVIDHIRICDVCGKRVRESMLQIHQEFHVNGGYLCNLCGKLFQKLRCRKEHFKRIHAPITEKLECDECEFITHSQAKLKDHKRKHAGVYFTCPKCPRKFIRNGRLQLHIKVVHDDIRQHPCPHCDRCFKTNASLTIHARIHSDEKPLKCEHCDYAGRQRTALNWHLMRAHGITQQKAPGAGRPRKENEEVSGTRRPQEESETKESSKPKKVQKKKRKKSKR